MKLGRFRWRTHNRPKPKASMKVDQVSKFWRVSTAKFTASRKNVARWGQSLIGSCCILTRDIPTGIYKFYLASDTGHWKTENFNKIECAYATDRTHNIHKNIWFVTKTISELEIKSLVICTKSYRHWQIWNCLYCEVRWELKELRS